MHLLNRLRVTATSVAAVISALTHVARHRGKAQGATSLAPGDEAPDFTLEASDGRTYRLSDYRGRQAVVLAWFPRAFTGGCTTQCESLALSAAQIRRMNVAFFGASVDSAATNRAFARSFRLDFPILSDPDTTTARAYGVLGASGYALRWTFYIGVDGRILDIDTRVHVRSHGPDVERRLNVLQAGGMVLKRPSAP